MRACYSMLSKNWNRYKNIMQIILNIILNIFYEK